MIISWGNFIRRSKSISELTSLEDVHLKPVFKKTFLKPINYLLSFAVSSWLIIKNRRTLSVLVLVTPPSLLLYLVFLARLITNAKIIIDCHNGTFSKKWLKVPLVRTCLKYADEILLHNDDFFQKVKLQPVAIGLNLTVVPDPPAISVMNSPKDNNFRSFVFPASYAADEPIDELILFLESKAFQELNSQIYLTGPSYKLLPDQIRRIKTIKNVHLTGFLDINEYEMLLNKSLGVLCLTKFEGIQLCAINEAVGFSCIPIYSCTNTLKTMYGSIGIPVNIDLSDLASVISSIFEDIPNLIKKVDEEKMIRLDEWKTNYCGLFESKN